MEINARATRLSSSLVELFSTPLNFRNILLADPGFISTSKEVVSMQAFLYYCKCFGLLLVVSLANLWPVNLHAQSDPTFHRNPQRTGWIPNETKLTPANVKGGQFGPLWNSAPFDSVSVGGKIYPPRMYASPLYIDQLFLRNSRKSARERNRDHPMTVSRCLRLKLRPPGETPATTLIATEKDQVNDLLASIREDPKVEHVTWSWCRDNNASTRGLWSQGCCFWVE
jgi:hypothetical protein